MKTLRDKIRERIELWSLNGSEFPGELTDEIMELVQEALEDERYYAAREADERS
jgi:hypothetical protein